MWRGLKASTKDSFNCEFKLIYATCIAKKAGAKMPGLGQIFSAGIKFWLLYRFDKLSDQYFLSEAQAESKDFYKC